jgi:hypothetical protein
MEIKKTVKNVMLRFISEQKGFSSDLYDFREIPIEVTQNNYNEALALRERYPSFQSAGVATFLNTIILWRVVDQFEFEQIVRSKRIVGGEYSVPIERNFGASFGGSRGEVIEFGLRHKRSGRLKGNLYLFGINAEDKEFLNLDMAGRFKEQGLEYKVGVFDVNSKLGNVGLGYSIRDVSMRDVVLIKKIDEENGHLIDLTYDYN